MTTYTAPTRDFLFVMEHLLDAGDVNIDLETLAAVLE